MGSGRRGVGDGEAGGMQGLRRGSWEVKVKGRWEVGGGVGGGGGT